METSEIRDAVRPIEAAIRDFVDTAADEIRAQYPDTDDYSDAAWEWADGSWWATYTWRAQMVVVLADGNIADDAWNDCDGFHTGERDVDWSAWACAVLAASILEVFAREARIAEWRSEPAS